MGVNETETAVLAACERAATDLTDAPKAAFVTWLVAQREGWPAARQSVRPSTWYRHLRLLRKAGIEVPYARPRGSLATCTHSDEQEPVRVKALNDGGALLRMVGKRVRLIHRFDAWTLAGTCGTVEDVLFRKSGWFVGVQFDGVPGCYEQIAVGRFTRLVEWLAEDAA